MKAKLVIKKEYVTCIVNGETKILKIGDVAEFNNPAIYNLLDSKLCIIKEIELCDNDDLIVKVMIPTNGHTIYCSYKDLNEIDNNITLNDPKDMDIEDMYKTLLIAKTHPLETMKLLGFDDNAIILCNKWGLFDEKE